MLAASSNRNGSIFVLRYYGFSGGLRLYQWEFVTSMEVVVVSSEFEMSELLAQLADSSETSVSRQKVI